MASSKVDTKAKAPSKSAAKKTVRKKTSVSSAEMSPLDRRHLICEAAYFLAEHRGFEPGNEMQDWLQAEAEVDARLRH